MAESKMPARINVGLHTGWSADETARMKGDTAYIRADIVERMAGALKEARDALNGAPNTIGLHSQIDTALTSYREASNVES